MCCAFVENRIDENALKNLTEKLIAELIPEIGLQAIFLNKWKDLIKISESTLFPIINEREVSEYFNSKV